MELVHHLVLPSVLSFIVQIYTAMPMEMIEMERKTQLPNYI